MQTALADAGSRGARSQAPREYLARLEAGLRACARRPAADRPLPRLLQPPSRRRGRAQEAVEPWRRLRTEPRPGANALAVVAVLVAARAVRVGGALPHFARAAAPATPSTRAPATASG